MADHYETLGVAPTATDREIKKAYFALVRQFPPETHAEDFRRIREAYELLSNPEAREEYDRARAAGGEVELFSEHGPELGSRLRAAAGAINSNQPKEAIPILEAVLQVHPDVIVAREMFGVALMVSGDAKRASEQFEELTRRSPKNALYFVRLGHAYNELKFDKPALAAYLKARELAPHEPGIRAAISDFHASRQRWKEALRELDEAAALTAGHSEKDWEPAIRRVGVQLARKSTRLVKRELAALLPTIPADEELRRHLSDRLASMAARAFVLQRPQDGNYLLEVARSLKPERQFGGFPTRLTVPVDQLPEASLEWLRQQPKLEYVKALWSRGYQDVVAVIGFGLMALGGGGLIAYASTQTSAPWDTGDWVRLSLLMAFGAWVTASGVLRMVRTRRNPLGKFSTLHPHYLAQVNLDRVTVWPLLNLVKISTVHSNYYGHVSSSVRMKFGRRTAVLNLRPELATGVAQHASQLRNRLVDLLGSGMLEADGEIDFVPRELRSARKERLSWPSWPRRLRAFRWQAACAAAAALAVVPLALIQSRAQDDEEWERARYTVTQVADYLEAHPDGRHAAQARAGLDRELEKGLQKLQATQQAQPGVLGELIAALRRAGTTRVRVVYSPSVKLGGFRPPGSFEMAKVALSGGDLQALHGRITTHLQRRIDQLAGPGTVELRDGIVTMPSASPVTLAVSSTLEPSGEVYGLDEDPAHGYYGLVFRSRVDLKLDGRATAHHYEVEAGPLGELRWEGGSSTPNATYGQMANSAADALGARLAVAMLGE